MRGDTVSATLVVKAGKTDKSEYTLEAGKVYFIGRSRDADVIVKDQRTSRRHAKLESDAEGKWTLSDQKSSNGTHLNRQRITSQPLQDGDVIQIGKATFEFRAAEDETIMLRPAAPPAEAPPQPAEPEPAAAETERAAPEAAPSPPESAPAPAPAAKESKVDKDLQDLFEFLDKIESGKPPPPREEPKEERDKESVAHKPPPQTARPGDESERDGDQGSLFELIDNAAPAESERKQQEPREEEKKQGGLLDFLKKKKQDS